MKDKIKILLRLEGRFNRFEYLKAQALILFLILLYFAISFKPIDLITSKENAADLSNFFLVVLIMIPHLALIAYGLTVNETKRLRDLTDKDLPIISVPLVIQFIPIVGFIFFIALFFLPKGKFKNSKFLEALEKLSKKFMSL